MYSDSSTPSDTLLPGMLPTHHCAGAHTTKAYTRHKHAQDTRSKHKHKHRHRREESSKQQKGQQGGTIRGGKLRETDVVPLPERRLLPGRSVQVLDDQRVQRALVVGLEADSGPALHLRRRQHIPKVRLHPAVEADLWWGNTENERTESTK